MKTLFLAFILISMIVKTVKTNKLITVQILQRHGPRYPFDSKFCVDKNYGELTSNGIEQHYQASFKLYEHYNKLNYSLDINSKVLMSSPARRCKLSAQIAILSFIEKKQSLELIEIDQKINNIQITQNQKSDQISRGWDSKTCQYQQQLFDRTIQQRNINMLEHSLINIRQKIESQLSQNPHFKSLECNWRNRIKQFDSVNLIYSTLDYIRYAESQGHVMDFDQDLLIKMEKLFRVYLHINHFQNENLLWFSLTPYFQNLLSHFEQQIKQPLVQQLNFINAHDITVAQVLTGLNLLDGNCLFQEFIDKKDLKCVTQEIPYSTYLSWELWETETQQYEVRLNLNGKQLQIFGQTEMIYSEFVAKIKSKINAKYSQLCKSQKDL